MPIKKSQRDLYPPRRMWQGIRRRRLESQDNRCLHCGVENYSVRGTAVVVLTVAHLDHDPGNNMVCNTPALCQRCRLHHDVKTCGDKEK